MRSVPCDIACSLPPTLDQLRQAVAQSPTDPNAWAQLGVALLAVDPAAAVEAFTRLTRLAPRHPAPLVNLGIALAKCGRSEEAIRHFNEAGKLAPAMAQVPYNLGNIHRFRDEPALAAAFYKKAIELQPDYPDAHWNLALCLLKTGDLTAGLPLLSWRHRIPGEKQPRTSIQPWKGQDLSGKTLLLWGEQGYGDVMQFIRFAPILAGMGARVIVTCHPELTRLASRVPGVWRALAPDSYSDDPIDFQIAMMDVPAALGTTLQTIPAAIPYLSGDPAPWKPLAGSGRHFGLVWAGRPTHANDANRSIPLELFQPLFNLSGITWHSLQVGGAADQLGRHGFPLLNPAPGWRDFADTAGYVAQLDVVITVDTAIAHLAGALGRQSWVLLPKPSDWRWLSDRDDSPWYPTMRLFRQRNAGDWQPVIHELVQAARHTCPTGTFS